MGKKKARSERADARFRLTAGLGTGGVSVDATATAAGLLAIAGLVAAALLSSAAIVRAARFASRPHPRPPGPPRPPLPFPQEPEPQAELAAPRRRIEGRRPWHPSAGDRP